MPELTFAAAVFHFKNAGGTAQGPIKNCKTREICGKVVNLASDFAVQPRHRVKQEP